jgi:outer membrane protein TolC
MLQKSAEITLLDLERQTDAFEISQNKYDAGLIREVDALQMEVDLAEAQSNHDIALLNQKSSVNSFKELLGVNLHDSISLKSELNYDIVIISPDLAVKYALENRLEIREQEIQIELQKLNIKQQKAAGMIKASLNAYFEKLGVNQEYNKGLFSSAGDSYGNYSDRPSNYGVGFSLRIPVFDWGENRARVKENESRLQEIIYSKEEVERSIETEVTTLVSRINSNLKRLQLLEKNVKVAEKSFSITLQRYSDGDIDSQTLALERNRMNTAYTSHLNAYINYQLSLADLMRKTFYDFQNHTLIE